MARSGVGMVGPGSTSLCFVLMVVVAFFGSNAESYNIKTDAPAAMRGAFLSEIGSAPVKIVLSDLYEKGNTAGGNLIKRNRANRISNGVHRLPHRMHFVVLWMLRRLFAANQIFGYINTRFWSDVGAQLDIYMRRWYDALPVRNMRIITYKALSDLFTYLEPRMAGTQGLEALDDILTDPDSTVLKIWTSKACTNIAAQSTSFEVAHSLLFEKFEDPLPFGHSVRRRAGVNPEDEARRIAQARSAPISEDQKL